MRVQLNVRVPAEIKELVERLAKERGKSKARILEEAIRLYATMPNIQVVNHPRTLLDAIISSRLADQLRRIEERNESVAWITDLTYCPMRWKLLVQIPSAAIEAVPNARMLRGTLAHLGLEFFAFLLGAQVEVPVEFQTEDGFTVRGRADIVLGDSVYELKFPAKVRELPQPRHAIQAWFYKIILGVKRAFVLYVTDDEIQQVEIDETTISNVLRQIKDFPLSPVSEKIRTPEFLEEWVNWWRSREGPIFGSWECRYCQMQLLCPLFKKYQDEKKEKK